MRGKGRQRSNPTSVRRSNRTRKNEAGQGESSAQSDQTAKNRPEKNAANGKATGTTYRLAGYRRKRDNASSMLTNKETREKWLPIVALTDVGSCKSKTMPEATNEEENSKKLDRYCWACHDAAINTEDSKVCKKCPRVYHIKCLGLSCTFSKEGVCPECDLMLVDHSLASGSIEAMDIRELLPEMFQKISEKWSIFKVWNGDPDQSTKICRSVDLDYIRDRLNLQYYKTTAEFFSDVKWIYHNMHIVYGPRHAFTIKAKALLNDFKNQLIDLESCSECFSALQNSKGADFTKICSNVHQLVWVKLRGHPYWPAKVLKVIDKKACVIFFGSHERSKVSVTDCYVLSKENPGGRVPKKESYTAALAEMQLYIQNYIIKFGSFKYAELKTPFNGQSMQKSPLKRPSPIPKKQRRKRFRSDPAEKDDGSGGSGAKNTFPSEVVDVADPELIVISDSEATSTTNGCDVDIDISNSSSVSEDPPSRANEIASLLNGSPDQAIVMDFYAERGDVDDEDDAPDYRKALLDEDDDSPSQGDDDGDDDDDHHPSPGRDVAHVVENILEVVAAPDPIPPQQPRNNPGSPSRRSWNSPGVHVALPRPIVRVAVEADEIQDAEHIDRNPDNVIHVVANEDAINPPPNLESLRNMLSRRVESALRPLIEGMCHAIVDSAPPDGNRVEYLRNKLDRSIEDRESLKEEMQRVKESSTLLLQKLQERLNSESRKRRAYEQASANKMQQLTEAEKKVKDLEAQINELRKQLPPDGSVVEGPSCGMQSDDALLDCGAEDVDFGSCSSTMKNDVAPSVMVTVSTQTGENENNGTGTPQKPVSTLETLETENIENNTPSESKGEKAKNKPISTKAEAVSQEEDSMSSDIVPLVDGPYAVSELGPASGDVVAEEGSGSGEEPSQAIDVEEEADASHVLGAVVQAVATVSTEDTEDVSAVSSSMGSD